MSRRGLTPATVIDAAGDLADAEGLDAVTIARLASLLGVRSPSIYNHVQGLAALRAGVAAAALRELHAALQAATVGRSGGEALLAAAHAYRRYALEHPGRYQAMQRAPGADAADLQARAEAVVSLLARLLAPWHLSRADAIHTIRGLRSAMHGFVDLERIGGFGIDLSLDRSYDRMVLGLVAGLDAANAG
jgi:AcrR family transcriptional regulator